MKLQYRITLLIFAILVVIGSAGAGAILFFQRQSAISRFEQSAFVLASILEGSLEREMVKADPAAIQGSVNNLALSPLINEVSIVSSTQKIFASGDVSDIGGINNDSQIIRSLNSGQPLTETKNIYGRNGVSVTLPINNKPECHSCHGGVPVIGAIAIGVDRSSLDDQLRSQAFIMLVMGGLTFAAIWTAIFLLVRAEIGNPLSGLAASARKLARHDFKTRVEVKKKDEVGVLGQAFNEMAEQLEKYSRDLESSKRELEDRVKQRTSELSAAKDYLQTTMDSLTEDLISVDPEYRITYFNSAFINHRGLRLDQVRGQHCYKIFRGRDTPCQGIDSECPVANVWKTGTSSMVIHRIPRVQGQILYIEITAYPVKDGTGKVIEVLELNRDITERKRIEAENARLYAEVQQREKVRGELLGRLLLAQEEERKRIARDLHDESAQALTMVMMDLARMIDSLPASMTQSREKLSASRSLVADTLANLRKLIQDLRPEVLDQLGLVPAIRSYVNNRLKTEGVQAKLSFKGLDDRLPTQIETGLFRIIQEAINNSLRHSDANILSISIAREDHTLSAVVEDDGKGFDVSTALGKQESWGLKGMQERVTIIGGKLEIESKPDQGTRVRIQVPLKGD